MHIIYQIVFNIFFKRTGNLNEPDKIYVVSKKDYCEIY